MVVAEGVTATLNVVLPVPLVVVPLLNVKVHAPLATTLPVIFVETPAHSVVFALLIVAVGRVFTVMAVLPVSPAEIAEHLLSVNEARV